MTDNQATEAAVHGAQVFWELQEQLRQSWNNNGKFSPQEAAAIVSYVGLLEQFGIACTGVKLFQHGRRHGAQHHRGIYFEVKGRPRSVKIGLSKWHGGSVCIWAETPSEGGPPLLLIEFQVSYDPKSYETLFQLHNSDQAMPEGEAVELLLARVRDKTSFRK